jgi:hypothetical protein
MLCSVFTPEPSECEREWRSRGDFDPYSLKKNQRLLLQQADGYYLSLAFPPGGRGVRDGMNLVVSFLIRVIEAMFVAGILGSAVVVLLTSIEDFKMLFEKEPTSTSARNT